MADAFLAAPKSSTGRAFQGIDFPVAEFLSQAVYCVEANVTYDSTDLGAVGSSAGGVKTLFNCPANTLIIGLAYQVQTAFTGVGTRPISGEIQVGDTNAADRYGTLGRSVMGSTRSKGFWPIFEEVVADVTIEATGFAGLDQVLSAGVCQFWLLYTPRSDMQELPGT